MNAIPYGGLLVEDFSGKTPRGEQRSWRAEPRGKPSWYVHPPHLVVIAYSLITSSGSNITGSQDGIRIDIHEVLPLAFFITYQTYRPDCLEAAGWLAILDFFLNVTLLLAPGTSPTHLVSE